MMFLPLPFFTHLWMAEGGVCLCVVRHGFRQVGFWPPKTLSQCCASYLSAVVLYPPFSDFLSFQNLSILLMLHWMRSSNMSGFLPRSRSLMDTQTTLEGTGDLHEGAYLERSKTVEQNGNGTVLPSPLKIFSAAKQKIRDIFQDLDGQMRESTSFLRSKW